MSLSRLDRPSVFTENLFLLVALGDILVLIVLAIALIGCARQDPHGPTHDILPAITLTQ